MRKVKGYMTLEASLIMPMVICVFVIIMSFTYYLYGRCILSQDTYILAFRASISKNEDGGDKAAVVASKVDDKLGKKYFGTTKPVIKTEVKGKEVIVRGYANVRNKVMGRYFLKPKTGWDFMAAGRAKERDFVGHIRKVKRYKDLGTGLLDRR